MYVLLRALTVTIIHQFSSKCVQTFFSVIAWPKEFKKRLPPIWIFGPQGVIVQEISPFSSLYGRGHFYDILNPIFGFLAI